MKGEMNEINLLFAIVAGDIHDVSVGRRNGANPAVYDDKSLSIH
jgi:hypothetical protein